MNWTNHTKSWNKFIDMKFLEFFREVYKQILGPGYGPLIMIMLSLISIYIKSQSITLTAVVAMIAGTAAAALFPSVALRYIYIAIAGFVTLVVYQLFKTGA